MLLLVKYNTSWTGLTIWLKISRVNRLKVDSPFAINNSGSRTMAGDLKILSFSWEMMELSASLAIDINSQDKKCPNSKSGHRQSSVSTLRISLTGHKL